MARTLKFRYKQDHINDSLSEFSFMCMEHLTGRIGHIGQQRSPPETAVLSPSHLSTVLRTEMITQATVACSRKRKNV